MLRLGRISLCAAVVVAGGATTLPPSKTQGMVDRAVVKLANGAKVRGHIGDGFRYFKAIPFAESPANERRWKPPVPKVGGQVTELRCILTLLDLCLYARLVYCESELDCLPVSDSLCARKTDRLNVILGCPNTRRRGWGFSTPL
jgi:hypothetical protein